MAGGAIDLLSESCDIAIRRMDFRLLVNDDYQGHNALPELAGPVVYTAYWNDDIVKIKITQLVYTVELDLMHGMIGKRLTALERIHPESWQHFDSLFFTACKPPR